MDKKMVKVRNVSWTCGIQKRLSGYDCTNLKDQKVRIFSHTKGPFIEIKYVSHRSPQSNQRPLGNLRVFDPQPSQQEPMREKGLSQKDLWVWLLFNGVKPSENPCKILRVLEKIVSAETLPAWTKRGREYKIKGGCQNPKILLEGSRIIQPLSWKHVLSYKRNNNSGGRTESPKGESENHGGSFQGFEN